MISMLTQHPIAALDDLYPQIVEKYWSDADFAARLHTDPKDAIEAALGVRLREETVKLAFSSQKEAVLVLPQNPIIETNSWNEEFASRTIFNCPCASSGTATGTPTCGCRTRTSN